MQDNKYYQILGLNQDADTDKVKRAYSVLLKKYKGDNEKLEELNVAYNNIMGYYVENKEEEQKAKSSAGKFNNFWYHHKWPSLVIILTSFALVVLVINSINNVPNDVNLHFIGNLYVSDLSEVQEAVYENLEDTKAPNVEQLILSDGGPLELEAVSSARMKLTSLIASGLLDVIITDRTTFYYLAEQGMFMPLQVTKDKDGKFDAVDGRQKAQGVQEVIEKSAANKQDSNDMEYAIRALDNLGEEFVFGIDLKGTRFIDFSTVMGKDLVVSMFSTPKNYHLAFELLDLLLNGDPQSETDEEDE